MRKLALAFALILTASCPIHSFAAGKITVDPNATSKDGAVTQTSTGAPVADGRLSQKVSYEARRKMLSEVAADLSRLTGIKYTCGRSNTDWHVQETRVDVFAKDITVSDLMNAIAHSAKCEWSRYPDKGTWSYCINEDQSTEERVQIRANMLEDEDICYRRSYLEQIKKLDNISAADLTTLKQDNPCLYLAKTAGLGKSIRTVFALSSAINDAWVKGQEVTVSTDTLNHDAQMLKDTAFMGAKQLYSLMSLPGEASASQAANNTLIEVHKPSAGEKLGKITIGGIPLLLLDPRDPAVKIRGRIVLTAAQQKRPVKEVFQEMKAEYMQALETKKSQAVEVDYLEEPLTQHPADSSLQQHIKLDLKGEQFEDLLSALASSSGSAVTIGYTSSLSVAIRQINWKTIFDTSKEVELKSVLDKIGEITHCNWQKQDSTIEFLDRRWIKNRTARVPDIWLKKWRAETSGTGTLSIETLVDIASLTDDQRLAVLSDDALSAVSPGTKDTLNGIINQNGALLRIYSTLEPDQRKALFDAAGLAKKALSQDQQNTIIALAVSNNTADILQASGDYTLYGAKQPQEKLIEFTFVIKASSGSDIAQYKFKTPEYPAAQTAEAKP